MTESLFALNGRVALVTGGNSGIGRALALALRDAGACIPVDGGYVASDALDRG